uniref:GATA-type domain-containing protein n=1 Tax=Mycena chlorophos TaxID=658473 RepID=A0ABQ0LXB7_MYCCL|nr:predicted protein [Mycena chlorophos]
MLAKAEDFDDWNIFDSKEIAVGGVQAVPELSLLNLETAEASAWRSSYLTGGPRPIAATEKFDGNSNIQLKLDGGTATGFLDLTPALEYTGIPGINVTNSLRTPPQSPSQPRRPARPSRNIYFTHCPSCQRPASECGQPRKGAVSGCMVCSACGQYERRTNLLRPLHLKVRTGIRRFGVDTEPANAPGLLGAQDWHGPFAP